MSKDIFILQKDLPDYKAGEKFEWNEKSFLYVATNTDDIGQVGKWPARFVENNPEWFKKEVSQVDWEILEVWIIIPLPIPPY